MEVLTPEQQAQSAAIVEAGAVLSGLFRGLPEGVLSSAARANLDMALTHAVRAVEAGE